MKISAYPPGSGPLVPPLHPRMGSFIKLSSGNPATFLPILSRTGSQHVLKFNNLKFTRYHSLFAATSTRTVQNSKSVQYYNGFIVCTIKVHDAQVQGGLGDSTENHKSIVFHSNTGSDDLKKNSKLPSRHSMLGHHRLASETPIKILPSP